MFQVLRSSAGAGKTHSLVKHYLVLALKQEKPSAYTGILALTFTNKAAAEMRERVLAYLQALASSDELKHAEADVRDEVIKHAAIPPEELKARAAAMHGHMLHHWSQVAISTIDAFTRRVVLPFARDLQLDHELRMSTEEVYFRSRAVELLLEEAGSDAALTAVLVATCEQLLEEERDWRPDKPLLALSKQLTQESAVEHLAALRDLSSQAFIDMEKRLRARTEAFRDRMRRLGSNALQAIAHAGLKVSDMAYADNGIMAYLRGLTSFTNWQEVNKNVTATLEKDTWYSGKADEQARAAIDGLAPMLRATVEEVERSRDNEMRDHAVRMAILQDLLPTASLNSLAQRLEAIKQQEGVSFFSDLTRKVLAIVEDEPAPFLYERLGEKYLHFLIDEFQDTSLMQWHALMPLVENALSVGGSVLLVGDAKQAIYRWRNGEARQFVDFPNVFRKGSMARGEAIEAALVRAHANIEPLVRNYRSARNIIAFSNAFTEHLKGYLDEDGARVFQGHEQEMVKATDGYVEVGCYDPKVKEPVPPQWAMMVQAVKDSLDDGFRLRDIAVLVRTGKQGADASRYLAEQGWDILSPDGLTLGADRVTCAVVAVLAWLHQPSDSTTAHAAQAIALVQAHEGATDPFSGSTGPADFMRQWHRANPRLSVRLPLVALICRIAEALGHGPSANIFSMGLVNEALNFVKTAGDDVGGFLEHWDRTAKDRSAGGSPGGEAIQVMTVHKAKGLQFPVVIVPQAGTNSRGGHDECIWITPEPDLGGPPSALVKKQPRLAELKVPEMEVEMALSKLDEVNVLYVAITRPEQRLYLSVPSGKKDQGIPRMLRDHLHLEAGAIWTSGTREQAVVKAGEKEGASPAFDLQAMEPQGERTLAIRREAPQEWDPADPDPLRRHGSAVHAILARVSTLQDLPHAVEMESAIWGLSPQASAAITEHLGHILAKPALQPFFGAGLEVRTEATLIDAEGHAHRPDRIVRDGDLMRVLDIKTGAVSEKHDEQVRGYMHLLSTVEQRPVEGWLLYVRDGELKPVAP
jgi:ATP-dependent exoDNAse (exonuclease V) beta subunit